MLNRIGELRRLKGLSQQLLADRVGTGKSQIVKLERGERRLDVRWIERLSYALEVPPHALLSEEAPRRVALAGYIGMGAEMHPLDHTPYGGIVCPIGLIAEETAAAIIRGDSMQAMADGWILFWRLGKGGVQSTEKPADCMGRLCVVKLADEGPCYVKKLRPGYTPGLYNLLSPNFDPIEDVKLEWVARIRLAVPGDELDLID